MNRERNVNEHEFQKLQRDVATLKFHLNDIDRLAHQRDLLLLDRVRTNSEVAAEYAARAAKSARQAFWLAGVSLTSATCTFLYIITAWVQK